MIFWDDPNKNYDVYVVYLTQAEPNSTDLIEVLVFGNYFLDEVR